MRYNRIWLTLALLAVILVLGGCMSVQDLTEQEAGLVAEYSAGVLLRYSDQYERRLITKDQRKGEDTVVSAPTVTSPAVSATPAPAPASLPDGSGDSAAPGGDPAASSDPGDPATDVQPVEADTSKQVSLNGLYHIKGLDFSYESYQFCDRYPKSSNSTSVITAGKGETLLVVRFRIRNKSGKKKKVNFIKRAQKISYIMTVDGNEYEPGLNILPNTGLNFLNTTIKKGAVEEAVLIYTMAKERQQAASIALQIKEGNNAVNVQLK